jgi:hypothetical protein
MEIKMHTIWNELFFSIPLFFLMLIVIIQYMNTKNSKAFFQNITWEVFSLLHLTHSNSFNLDLNPAILYF